MEGLGLEEVMEFVTTVAKLRKGNRKLLIECVVTRFDMWICDGVTQEVDPMKGSEVIEFV